MSGYSRLMGEDELETIYTLNAYKEIMGNLIQQHYGRVVDAPGDNVLAEFASVVGAVECAVEIQKELKNRNAEYGEATAAVKEVLGIDPKIHHRVLYKTISFTAMEVADYD
jgi:class 3 adenylate cyclase